MVERYDLGRILVRHSASPSSQCPASQNSDEGWARLLGCPEARAAIDLEAKSTLKDVGREQLYREILDGVRNYL